MIHKDVKHTNQNSTACLKKRKGKELTCPTNIKEKGPKKVIKSLALTFANVFVEFVPINRHIQASPKVMYRMTNKRTNM